MEKTKVEQAKEYITRAIELIGFVMVFDLVTVEFNKRVTVNISRLFF
jgi:hypothetical protein